MLHGVHIIGYGPSDAKCLPCSGISRRVAPLYPCSSRFNHKSKSQIRIGSPKGACKGVSFTCRASSSGRNRNPDFPRQNRHGYSRSRNRKSVERDGFENLDESDMLSSKNGSLVSLSSNTKFGATASPGPREKEIVELFRKVQAQLRERSAAKEERNVEASQGHGKENATVDSLLNLLRKHSVEQSKRNSNSGSSNKDFTLDQPEKNSQYSERKNTASFNSNNLLKDEVEEPTASFSRPASNFQRKSPIPRLTYQAIYSEDDHIGNTVPHVNSTGKRTKNHVDRVPKPEPEPKLELEAELDHEPEHDAKFEFEPEPEPEQGISQLLEDETSEDKISVLEETLIEDDENKGERVESRDLSTLKLPELRVLAKSRGAKGFSKMKKAELLELLSGSAV
ncbi:rho-N domain-containing protein 1, chloroplastic-like [Pyrus x bretschneideri]|uniref:rho-N domain-containing protein 1, chloroplastic-like n=1 Tax=Pyrus x bretschneideri TaxID=225117 RepID=UPI00202F3E8B|nr:rho-N domain-containing protein 1, chloroplastic-like [Pyrus x bretschneideri]